MDSVNHKENFQERVYYQVIEYIKLLVKEGKLEFGRKLPSEREMMERLDLAEILFGRRFALWSTWGLLKAVRERAIFL